MNPFQQFGNGKVKKKEITKVWERKGNENIGNGNQRLSFLGRDGNWNSHSPLKMVWIISIGYYGTPSV